MVAVIRENNNIVGLIKKLFVVGLLSLLLMPWAVTFVLAAPPSDPLPGAVFTTDIGCTGVNLNIFNTKDDVYIDGGPKHPGAAGLPDGSYWVQVTDPSGATVLGKSPSADVTVVGGKFFQCYQLSAIVNSASSGFSTAGYDNTGNPGGEYKVWVSMGATFTNSSTKTDNFKVKPDVVIPRVPHLLINKFYDTNVDGNHDDTEPWITGWKVNIHDGINWDRYTLVDLILAPDLYTVTEYKPVEINWIPTTPISTQKEITEGGSNQEVDFGNVCLGAGGGLTLGFWSNKNGQVLIDGADLASLTGLNLRKADGTDFDPANYSVFRTWILNAKATNMSYMLSAQLAAMELNVFNGMVTGDSLIYAPGTTSGGTIGFATVSAVMTEANTELGLHGLVLSGSPYRSYQEALKNALDKANNNLTFVQPTPCAFSFEKSSSL